MINRHIKVYSAYILSPYRKYCIFRAHNNPSKLTLLFVCNLSACFGGACSWCVVGAFAWKRGRFHVLNVHTMDELKLTGNSMLGSRPLLNFDAKFDQTPHWQ